MSTCAGTYARPPDPLRAQTAVVQLVVHFSPSTPHRAYLSAGWRSAEDSDAGGWSDDGSDEPAPAFAAPTLMAAPSCETVMSDGDTDDEGTDGYGHGQSDSDSDF